MDVPHWSVKAELAVHCQKTRILVLSPVKIRVGPLVRTVAVQAAGWVGVGGTGVLVGGTGVLVGVGEPAVAVGDTGVVVEVGAPAVAVGGTGVDESFNVKTNWGAFAPDSREDKLIAVEPGVETPKLLSPSEVT